MKRRGSEVYTLHKLNNCEGTEREEKRREKNRASKTLFEGRIKQINKNNRRKHIAHGITYDRNCSKKKKKKKKEEEEKKQ